jgi:FAM192A/Fyv6, N-terminal domain
MSSRFVSGGTTDAPLERSDEWLAAQEELEANRQRKAEESRRNNGRSLYETLEANKGTFLISPISLSQPGCLLKETV